jgi:hypothetical protein
MSEQDSHLQTRSDDCKICGASTEIVSYGFVSPWCVKPGGLRNTTAVKCRECDFVFFTRRYSNDELQLIYSGYREESYFRRRHRYEPWYTRRTNFDLGNNLETIERRRQNLEQLLEQALNLNNICNITSVVDIGGDKGQFIPRNESISRRAVMEVSSAPTERNVQRLSNWEEVKRFNPNLIMMCHVLEHLNEPRNEVGLAVQCIPSGCFLYIEVPLDKPITEGKWFGSRAQRLASFFVVRSPLLSTVIDAWSLTCRKVFGHSRIPSVLKQTEHVNYFSENAVRKLLGQFGCEMLTVATYDCSPQGHPLPVKALCVLAKKT